MMKQIIHCSSIIEPIKVGTVAEMRYDYFGVHHLKCFEVAVMIWKN